MAPATFDQGDVTGEDKPSGSKAATDNGVWIVAGVAIVAVVCFVFWDRWKIRQQRRANRMNRPAPRDLPRRNLLAEAAREAEVDDAIELEDMRAASPREDSPTRARSRRPHSRRRAIVPPSITTTTTTTRSTTTTTDTTTDTRVESVAPRWPPPSYRAGTPPPTYPAGVRQDERVDAEELDPETQGEFR